MSPEERSVGWDAGDVVVIDQTALPHELRILRLTTVDEVIDAVARLAVRGAPALGLVGALGVALAATRHAAASTPGRSAVYADARRLAAARPTAVNLGWGVRRALSRLTEGPDAVLAEALEMLAEDERVNRAVARRTADLVQELCGEGRVRVLTHCNTGRLATAAWGTALGAIRDLAAANRIEHVLVTETRPLLQGARLTAWELAEAGIPHRLCVDSAAPAAMARGLVDCVLVGADRIAANGDVANKIGTYGLAVAAARHAIPFLVAAPESTVDETVPDGSAIVVEDRPAEELTTYAGQPVAPAGTLAFNPAFDVTPAELITAVVTEQRMLQSADPSGGRPEHPTPLSGA
ncbi:MAG: S-methyl-5-thioribose-1-phosphate isomerase [Pseudonocardiaceae bacterium]